jgi:predicted nucleic acid-binding Zn ribbon protein
MPIYEFECDNELCEANARYDKELKINEPHDVVGPFGGSCLLNFYCSVPELFIGSGFYSTDSK